MSVENLNVVDFISINLRGEVVLSIADHLQWDEDNEHLVVIQNKLNAYLEFIKNGDLYVKYPDAKNRNILIRVVLNHQPNSEGGVFFERVRKYIEGLGYRFSLDIIQG